MGSLLSAIQLPVILFFIGLSTRAILSFLETSVTALRLFKLKELAQSTKQYDTLFKTLEQSPHRVLITILIANNLADAVTIVLAAHITQTIFESLQLSSSLGVSVGVAFASLTTIVFGEIIPKNLAKGQGERLFQSMLWLMNILFYVLYPLVTVLIKISDYLVFKITKKRTSEGGSEWVSSEREIQFLIDYIHEKGLMEPEKTEMLQNVFDLGHTPVKEIMVPATDIISVNVSTTIKNTLELFSKHRYTRMPVYENQSDNFIGMVHQKDIFVLLSNNEDKPLKDIMRPMLFVPETVKVSQLLREFRQQQMHIAIVLNEHGSVTGLITLEDVLEEIVGEISDEHEPVSEKIIPLKQGGWLVDASIPLEDLEPLLSFIFETEDSVTLGGFMTEQLQHLPKKGERVLYKEYYFQVQKASQKRVQQVLIFAEKSAQPTIV
ncbi:MAG: hemolysin family protein [Candidatus Dependentiae bacterium]|nr:hemolysin family protein [Candidatus Dependentiae bacterium]